MHSLISILFQFLWLSGNRLTSLEQWDAKDKDGNDNDNKKIMRIFLPRLEKLFLQDNCLTCLQSASADTFYSSFGAMPLLSDLDLSFNSIENVEALTCLSHCHLLTSLLLQDNPLTQPSALRPDASHASYTETLNQWLLITCPSLKMISGTECSHFHNRGNHNIPASHSAAEMYSVLKNLREKV